MKQTMKLAELAAKLEIVPAEAESAEFELGLTAEDAAVLKENVTRLVAEDDALTITPVYQDILAAGMEQSAESAQLDADIAAGSGSRVAVIPVVDRVVDTPVVRGPIDVRIGGNHIKNPG